MKISARTVVLTAGVCLLALSACGSDGERGGGIQSIGFGGGSGCELTDSARTFSTGDRVHYVALFEPVLETGDEITVAVSHDGERQSSLSSVLTLAEPTDCIQASLGMLDPGDYEVAVSSRLGTDMPPVSGRFEVTGAPLDRAPVGEVWFGSSYDLETYEIEGRTDSIETGVPFAFVTQFDIRIDPADLMLRLSRDGELVQHERVEVPGQNGSHLYGFAGTAPPEAGTWTFDFTDADEHVLATGDIEVTSTSASASPRDGVEVSAFDLEAGDCYSESSSDEELETVMVVDCNDPHVFETYHVLNHEAGAAGAYPGHDQIDEYAERACESEFEDFVGRDYRTSIWYINWVTPSADSWAEGDREITCTLATEDYEQVTGSAAGSGE